MVDRLLPTPEDINTYHERKAEEAEFDTGLHAMSGPEIGTPEWVVASWHKAAANRIASEQST